MVCFQVKYKRASTSANPRQPRNSVRFRIVLNPDREGLKMDIGALMATIRLPVAISAAGVPTSRGTLLLDPLFKGKQFNRSIFVSDGPGCLYGYDFHDPDKNLFQGRDRNSMKQQRLLVECGTILSEAIVSTPEVCQAVLQAFKYPRDYKPGESKDELQRYEDLREGEHLSPAALGALRRAELNRTGHTKQTVFCAHVPSSLKAIVDHQGLRVVFTHPVLHNHENISNDFHGALAVNAQTLSLGLRVGAHQKRIGELMGVTRVLHSGVPHASGRCTFWRKDNTLYITSPEQLGSVLTTGFTESQEVALYRTLLTCKAPEESVVRIMRLLREGHEHDEAPAAPAPPSSAELSAASDSFSSPAPAKAASTVTAASSTTAKSAPVKTSASTTSSTKPTAAKTASSATGAAPGATSTSKPSAPTARKNNGSTQTMPTFARHCGVQTLPVHTQHVSSQTEDTPKLECVSEGTDPHIPYPVPAPPAPPAPLVRTHATQTDFPEAAAVSAPRPATGTYTRHASSGMWLHGQSAQQHQELAELIEDSVQTEEGQRRLRRLSGQLYLVASVEQPHGLKK